MPLAPPPPSLAALIQRNVDLIAQLEATAQAQRSLSDRVADQVTRFGGSMAFVYGHIVWFSVWMLLPFDPYPFQFLTLVVSLEAIFLSTFILISQQHQQRTAELRHQLDLQINLLSEQENSQMLAMLETLLHAQGITLPEGEVTSLKEPTQPVQMAQQIEASRAQ